eukprot:544357-Pelagomonas_calceolata.AAC.5
MADCQGNMQKQNEFNWCSVRGSDQFQLQTVTGKSSSASASLQVAGGRCPLATAVMQKKDLPVSTCV